MSASCPLLVGVADVDDRSRVHAPADEGWHGLCRTGSVIAAGRSQRCGHPRALTTSVRSGQQPTMVNAAVPSDTNATLRHLARPTRNRKGEIGNRKGRGLRDAAGGHAVRQCRCGDQCRTRGRQRGGYPARSDHRARHAAKAAQRRVSNAPGPPPSRRLGRPACRGVIGAATRAEHARPACQSPLCHKGSTFNCLPADRTDRYPPSWFVAGDDPVRAAPTPGRLGWTAVLFRIVLSIPALLLSLAAIAGCQRVRGRAWMAAPPAGWVPEPLIAATDTVPRSTMRTAAGSWLLAPGSRPSPTRVGCLAIGPATDAPTAGITKMRRASGAGRGSGEAVARAVGGGWLAVPPPKPSSKRRPRHDWDC